MGKKQKLDLNGIDSFSVGKNLCAPFLPTLESCDYFMEPSLSDMASRELMNPGYCSRVQDFTVGRLGYGCVKFTGETDVRWLDLNQIVKFSRHVLVVYEDEYSKPVVGQGLNKAAEVTLVLRIRYREEGIRRFVNKLRLLTETQGADFISFDPLNGEWKFKVHHFSGYGLDEDDEEDISMHAAVPQVEEPQEINGGQVSDLDDTNTIINQTSLLHSLPAHLGLDPVKMRDMRMLMFSVENENEYAEEVECSSSHQQSFHIKSKHPSYRRGHVPRPPAIPRTPSNFINYSPGNFESSPLGSILMAQQNKGLSPKPRKLNGFKLDLRHDPPVPARHSCNIGDAAFSMGRPFGVGWGPGGILVHAGAPVGNSNLREISSVVNLEKVSFDKVVRDKNSKVSDDLIKFCFVSLLNFHKALNHETKEVRIRSCKLKLQKLACDPFLLSEICRGYIGITEKQLEVPGLTSYARVILMHQVRVWNLINVLFSSKGSRLRSKPLVDNEDGRMHNRNNSYQDIDQEALPVIQRAEFSCWLQESVCDRVKEELSLSDELNDLQKIFLFLTGRQLDAAVKLSASRGDIRLACLLGQAVGSEDNCSDISRQLEIWRENEMDFDFIETDRMRLLELLAGNVQGALDGVNIDWKRFLGLLMWYKLPPTTSLSTIFRTYQKLLNDGIAPSPVPVYINEGEVKGICKDKEEQFDLSYYLMLLYASGESKYNIPKTMFSAVASTKDPLDCHMIWHQRAVLQALGTFNSNDLHILDMGLVSQLLSLGLCHWAIYVVLHIPYRADYPYLHATTIREILFMYCETWSSQEKQIQFIEELGIPPSWMDEALSVYSTYCGDMPKALEHLLRCANWQEAHSVFVTSVAHSLFLSGKHSEVCRLATSMEDHKSKINIWDLGAGIYVSFYQLKSILQEDNGNRNKLDPESKSKDCKEFLSRLDDILTKFGRNLPINARIAYTKMAEEVCNLLLADSREGKTCDIRLSRFNTVLSAPLPEDHKTYHLQGAISFFTSCLPKDSEDWHVNEAFNIAYSDEVKLQEQHDTIKKEFEGMDLIEALNKAYNNQVKLQKQPDTIKKKRCGFSLMEVFNIRYLGRDKVYPEEQHGTITIICDSGFHFQYLYNVPDVDLGKPSIKYKDDIPITVKGPTTFFQDALIKFDLFSGAYKGTIEVNWHSYMLSRAPVFFEERKIQSRDGTGAIAVLMGQFSNATIATLEVRVLNRSAATNVYGIVVANNSKLDRANCTSVLFVRKDDYKVLVGPDGVIPLSKSCVGVPLESVLYVDFSLHVDGHLCTGTVTFDAETIGVREGCERENDPMIQVKVNWNGTRYSRDDYYD
ncbi:Suppressor of auxin resistance 3 [Heracleum sosnowskyi]|uniref:Suppressor of auxin resistance 3 n=1 Tax=Heracleum sosnowskyi TaxID=360622 RepID=A0AAD8J1P9_9APIA|nr:Suppressor of auxin resistance 3 [Heracleum sosnowskyi]